MTRKTESTKKYASLYASEELLNKLKEKAREEDRSRNNVMIRLIRKGLEEEQKQKTK